MSLENIVKTDVLVVGGGIAGFFAAIKVRDQGLNVSLVDKAYAGKSGASISIGAGWMVHNPEWGLDFDDCMDALVRSGEYINNREWSATILKDSLEIYQDMIVWGTKFPPLDMEIAKAFRPFGHTGVLYRKTTPALRKHAEEIGVNIIDRTMVTDLLKQDGKIVGATGFHMESYDLYIFKAKATILCGGGNSFKPPGFPISMLTGDAEGMAYRAGAEITGKEFHTTHLTMAVHPAALLAYKLTGGSPFLGYFTDAEGEKHITFVEGGKTGTRTEPDLDTEFLVHAGKAPIFCDFDAATPEEIAKWLEMYQRLTGEKECKHKGKVQLAGGAAAGYAEVGTSGIWVVNTKGATSIPGLYAAGDCGGTRHNGAYNTAPGMGSAPAAVIGRRAGAGAAEYALQTKDPRINEKEISRLKKVLYAPRERKSGFSPRWVTQLLKNTMIPYFILYIKHGERLQAALKIVEFLRDHHVPKLFAKDSHELRLAHETKNMVLNAEMILRSSLFRTESRGTHYREDYPRRDDPSWLAWTKVKDEKGRMEVFKEQIPKEWWPDLSLSYKERYPIRFPGESVE